MQAIKTKAVSAPFVERGAYPPCVVQDIGNAWLLDNGSTRVEASKVAPVYLVDGVRVSLEGANKPRRIYLKGKRKARVFYEEVFPGVDVVVHLHAAGIGFQKIIKRPEARHEFITRIQGRPERHSIRIDAMAVDNWDAAPVPHRIVSPRQQVLSTEEQYSDGDELCIRQRVLNQSWRVDPVTRARRLVDEVIYPIRLHVTLTDQMVADDNAYWAGRNTDTGIGEFYRFGHRNAVIHVGLVFQPGEIPSGATIDSATLTWQVDSAGSRDGSADGDFFGDESLTQGNFSASDRPGQLSNYTEASVTADCNVADVTTDVDIDYDVHAIVEELIAANGGDWGATDLMRFVWYGTGSDNYGGHLWTPWVYAIGTDLDRLPQIEIIYTEGGGGGGLPIGSVSLLGVGI